MEVTNRDSSGFHALINYQEALGLQYLGLLFTDMDRWIGCELSDLAVYIYTQDIDATLERIDKHFKT